MPGPAVIFLAPGLWQVAGITFASFTGAYAYAVSQGYITNPIEGLGKYFTGGKDELTTLEELGIVVDQSTKTQPNYYYSTSENDAYNEKVRSDLYETKKQWGQTSTVNKEKNQKIVLEQKDFTNNSVNSQVQELVNLETKKDYLIQTKEYDKLSMESKNFLDNQINNKSIALRENVAVNINTKSGEAPTTKDRIQSLDTKSTVSLQEKPLVNAPKLRAVADAERISGNKALRSNAAYQMSESTPTVAGAGGTGQFTGAAPGDPQGGPYSVTSNLGNNSTDVSVGVEGESSAVYGAATNGAGQKTVISTKSVGENVLYDLEPYTYDFTLNALSEEEYIAGKFDRVAESQPVIKSSGLPTPEVLELPAGSQLNSHIRSMRLSSVVGLNSKTVTSNVHNLQFTVFEPFGTSLLQDLHDAAIRKGHSNYLRAIYLLTVKFHGYTDDGRPVTEYGPTKFFPIKIVNCEFNVTGGGTDYTFDAVPYNARTMSDNRAKLFQVVNLKGSTVGELLFDLQDQLNEQPSVAKKDEKFYRIRIIGDGTNLERYGEDDGKVEQSPIEQYINTSSILIPGSGPMFVHAQEIFNATMNHDLFSNSLAKEMFELTEEGKKFKESTGMDLSENSDKTGIGFNDKFTRRVYTFNRGTPILNIIQAIIDSSDYVLRQTKTDKVMDIGTNSQGDVPWYKIDYKTIPGDSPHMFAIRPFMVDQFKAYPDERPTKYNVKSVAREYDYIYTGNNRDILDFDINYNFAFFAASAAQSDTTKVDAQEQNQTGTKKIAHNYAPNLEDGYSDPDKGLVPVESETTDADDNNTTQGGEQGAVQGYRASNIIKEQLSNPQADLINLDLDILGDPYFLVQEDFNPHFFSASEVNSYELEDGSIDVNNGMVYVKVNFKTPVDIDDEAGRFTGLQGTGKYDTSFFGGVFQLIQIESNFEEGRFTQRLTMVRLRHQELERPQTGTTKGPAGNDAFDTGTEVGPEGEGETVMKNTSGSKSETPEKTNSLLNTNADATSSQSNVTKFPASVSNIGNFFASQGPGDGRYNPDSKNFQGNKSKTNVTADNKVIGQP